MKTKLAFAALIAGIPVSWALIVLSSGAEHRTSRDKHPKKDKHRVDNGRPASTGPTWSRPLRFAPSPVAQPEESPDARGPEQSEENRIARKIQFAQQAESDFISDFEREVLNSQWANQWEDSIDGWLVSNMSSLPGFESSEVECRSERCVATVAWSNYTAAGASLQSAMTLTAGRCRTAVLMTPPTDDTAAYEHKIRFVRCQGDAEL